MIQQTLIDMSAEQGWNQDSQVSILCDFISSLKENADIPTDFDAKQQFQAYLQNRMDEENQGVEAVCERCGKACEYDSTLCLCKFCITEAASK